MEDKIIPYDATQCISANSVVVFAPHPDDEVFGCGGAILRHVMAGVPMHVVIVSDGAFNVSDEERQELIEIREAESRKAAIVLGYGEPEFWRLPDRGIEYGEALIERLMQSMEAHRADLVYAPSLREMHPDHRQLAMAAVETVRRLGSNLSLAMYEVGIPLQQPSRLLDISNLLDRKQAAMACFVSQLRLQPYDEQILALNRYRAYTLPKEVTAAEAYQLVTNEALAQDPLQLYQPEYARQQALGLPQVPDDLPLVSVLIRSMDRPTLREALDSVTLQTYGHIEVLVVAACGRTHSAIGEACGRFPLRLEFAPDGRPLPRPHAANLALEKARGQWLIFLDDDDTFDPDHIAGLIQTLSQHPQTTAIYAGVRVEDDDGRVAGIFNFPYDPRRLLASNFIPIHALLFSRDLVGEGGARFDENMEVYEDWDFWLQLSCHTSFLHMNKISAVYRAFGDSGVGLTANEDLQQQGREHLFDKWRLLWTGRDINHLAQYVLEQDGQIASFTQTVAERDGLIAALYNSTSWRITQPLRFVSHQLKRIRRIGELVRPAIKRGGGLRNTLNKAIQLYRRGGLAGIRHGLRIVATSGHINPALGSGEFDRNDYVEWIRQYDTLTDEIRATMRTRIGEFAHHRLISVVMPVYNPKPEWLIEAIESVRKQIYPHWELCIADDASPDKSIRPILERYVKEDTRIKVVFRETNGHISEASNSALELACGEWVALLDHDDLLSEHALFWVVDAIDQNHDAHLIYSDEDKIDEVGRRFDPYFKCDWNVDLFYSHNLITHLGVYRLDLLNAVGGFRLGMEGAQDYDLALRSIERIEPNQIHHIPRVLYHWRMHAESTAQSADAKPYAMLAGERALNEHFLRRSINAKVEFVGHGYRVRYAQPDNLPMVSLIIPTRNGLQLIRQCIDSILEKTIYPNYEILIVDNGSDDPATLQYFDELQAETRVRVVHDNRPFNFSALNNAAVKLARGEVLGLLNNDLEVISPEWLTEMVSISLQPGVGAVGARLWYPDNTLQHGGVIAGVGGVAGHSHKNLARYQYGYFSRAVLIQSFSVVTAACLVIRKAIYEEVGGLNETNLQIAFNDVDFCLRVREAGYRNVWTPYAELYHHESATRGYEDTPEKQARFAKEVQYMMQRWGKLLLSDPAYSPNLTLDHQDFSLAWPPRCPPL
jgi:glycosyltransferase involved in cell wall biosynthesis/LmbE family N-acetylglucosaminyl deacetylase